MYVHMHTYHGTHMEIRAQLSGIGSLLHPELELGSSGLAALSPSQPSLELLNAFRHEVTSPRPFLLGVSWDATDHRTAP